MTLCHMFQAIVPVKLCENIMEPMDEILQNVKNIKCIKWNIVGDVNNIIHNI